MNYSNSELFNYFGGILGILVSVIILVFTKGRSAVKISLSLLLIVSSLIVIMGALNYSEKVILLPYLIRMDSPLHYLFGPLAYFYILASLRNDFRYRFVHLVHLLPALLNFLFFLPFYLESNEIKVLYYQSWMETGSYVMPLQYLFKTFSGVFYFCLEIYLIVKYYPRVSRTNGSDRHVFSWYFLYLAGQFIMTAGLLIDHSTGLNLFDDPYRYAINMVSLFLFSTSLALLFFPRILYGNEKMEYNIKKKYSLSTLSDQEKTNIMNQLISHMNSTIQPFLDPDLTLVKLSSILKISSNQLSQVINEETGMNFNEYVNQYRIDYAKKLLISPDYHKFTIDAIAMKAGFNSKSPFYNAFKKATGLTPRQYILNTRNSVRSIS